MDDRGQQVIIRFRKRDYAKIFLSGFFMNTLNPAIFLFWITTSTTLITHTVKETDHYFYYLSFICTGGGYCQGNAGR